MALTRYKFGDFIQQRREKYAGVEELPCWGVSKEGFIQPKQDGVDKSIYNVFYKFDFVFNPARMELNSIALNTQFDKAICSSLYEVFYVTRPDIVLPEYLNLFIKRDEFARKCWFEAIGSARNYFRVANLSEFEINLPSLSVQQKYVDVYNAMLANQQSYERGIEDLKTICDGFIEELQKKVELTSIGAYLNESQQRNVNNLGSDRVRGLSTNKEIIDTKADMLDVDLKSYKTLSPGQIAYVADTSRRGDKVAMGFNDSENTYLVSSIYTVFDTDTNKLLPEYLMLFFQRTEFDRYARYNSWGSARETFDWDEMCNVKIPIPDILVQRAITRVYTAYKKRKQINERLKNQIRDICPILVKGSIEDKENNSLVHF